MHRPLFGCHPNGCFFSEGVLLMCGWKNDHHHTLKAPIAYSQTWKSEIPSMSFFHFPPGEDPRLTREPSEGLPRAWLLSAFVPVMFVGKIRKHCHAPDFCREAEKQEGPGICPHRDGAGPKPNPGTFGSAKTPHEKRYWELNHLIGACHLPEPSSLPSERGSFLPLT